MFAGSGGVFVGKKSQKGRKSASLSSSSSVFERPGGSVGLVGNVQCLGPMGACPSPIPLSDKSVVAGTLARGSGSNSDDSLDPDLQRRIARAKLKGPAGSSISPKLLARIEEGRRNGGVSFRCGLELMYRQTSLRLDELARNVRECRCVGEANEFCKYLNLAGLPSFLDGFKHLISDYSPLSPRVRELMMECGELFRTKRADPKYNQSDIAEIQSMLRVLLSRDARPVSPGVSAGGVALALGEGGGPADFGSTGAVEPSLAGASDIPSSAARLGSV